MAISRGFDNLIQRLRELNKSVTDSFINDVADINNSPVINIYEHIKNRTPEGRAFLRHYATIFGNQRKSEFLRLVNRRYINQRIKNRLIELFNEGVLFGSYGELIIKIHRLGNFLNVDHLLEDRIFRIFADGSDEAISFGFRKLISNFDGNSPIPLHDLARGRTDSISTIVPIDDIVMHQMLFAGIINAPYIHTHKTLRVNQMIPLGTETARSLDNLWSSQRYILREFLPLDDLDSIEEQLRNALKEALLHGIERNTEHNLLCHLLDASTINSDHLNIIDSLRRSDEVLDVDSEIYLEMEGVLDDILSLDNNNIDLTNNVFINQFTED